MKFLSFCLLPALALAVATPTLAASAFAPKGEHVVLIVWDGMRPDFVTEETTPTLFALAKTGTAFAAHHAAYITSTEVNGTVIATGCHPARSGVFANRAYLPDIDPRRAVDTQSAATIRRGDQLRGGAYLGVPTLAEIIRGAGFRTIIAGTKPVALLHDRQCDRSAVPGSAVVFSGKAYPESVLPPLLAALGPFPEYPLPGTLAPNTAQNAWTTQALVSELWREGVPKFSTLWLGDPDFSQHLTEPGTAVAKAALKDCDDNLAVVLAALEAKGVRAKTNVFLVSDHGFSTIERALDLGALIRQAGFTLVSEYQAAPQPGEILEVSLGGSTTFYVPDHDPILIKKLTAFLQTTDFAGPIFTRAALPGTFPLSAAWIDAKDAPDLMLSARWHEGKNAHGADGLLIGEGRRSHYGTHASLSRYDVHNTLIAAGPDIRGGFTDLLPSGNLDVAPTLLFLLGIAQAQPMDGRVLAEALLGTETSALPPPLTETLEVTCPTPAGKWRQSLQFTSYAGRTYLDEGNASLTPAKTD